MNDKYARLIHTIHEVWGYCEGTLWQPEEMGISQQTINTLYRKGWITKEGYSNGLFYSLKPVVIQLYTQYATTTNFRFLQY